MTGRPRVTLSKPDGLGRRTATVAGAVYTVDRTWARMRGQWRARYYLLDATGAVVPGVGAPTLPAVREYLAGLTDRRATD